jgi:hypothetical protein
MSALLGLRSILSRWGKWAAEGRAPHAAALAFLFTATVLFAAAPTAAQPPPELETAFVLDPGSVFVTTKLTPPQQDQVRDRISRRLAELGASRFGFLRWRPAGQPGAAGAARLTVTLRDVPKQSGQDNVIELSVRRGNAEVPLSQLGRTVVYRWFDLPKPSDPGTLGDRVVQKLEELFANEAFRRELHASFLRGIPLAEEVRALGDDQRILVPLSWDELRPSSESVLLVKFVAASQKPGEMQLSLVKKRLAQPRRGALQAAIKLFDCAPITLSNLGAWNPQIPGLLEGAKQVRVFMESYVHDVAPDVENGLVTSPQ